MPRIEVEGFGEFAVEAAVRLVRALEDLPELDDPGDRPAEAITPEPELVGE